MKIIFGSDYQGKKQVERMKRALSHVGKVVDVVEKNPALDNYIDISKEVSRLVKKHKTEGILMCGTGSGTAICANKHKGIYAVACYELTHAKNAKIINNANVLCLSAFTPVEKNIKIAMRFLETKYQGRKPHRLKAVRKLEKANVRQS
ncbi:hypothetical protein A2851_01185 [Candidatus Kaiserbacteria bacterium RIFCSPHIGHO2_01_FULL_53_29]|uniref:Ribose-5-phosphate isomerase n=1 Tax=Candidatus Kaiserbacteria bacterium RIFCSPHIGHO2_01_FULL_53_29 TaxID=1798480 RepID=A0A1F6CZ02_9BACT|nr:MAG: hypothetical protein A2851_01185 [Candidatus Kaiserbacteria bacterium RIFCSPHIGHO2_01_FULL_53_29]